MNINEIRNELSDIVHTSVYHVNDPEDSFWRLLQKVSNVLEELDKMMSPLSQNASPSS